MPCLPIAALRLRVTRVEGTQVFGASEESGQIRKTEEFTSTNASNDYEIWFALT